jgi:RNA recognition motif-containing protein
MNIFVTKLSYGTTEDSLRGLFEEFGEVSSAKIIMDRDTGRSKGYGFVEMPDDDAAQQAISELNESDFEDRTIVVKKANPKEGGGGNRGGYNRRY